MVTLVAWLAEWVLSDEGVDLGVGDRWLVALYVEGAEPVESGDAEERLECDQDARATFCARVLPAHGSQAPQTGVAANDARFFIDGEWTGPYVQGRGHLVIDTHWWTGHYEDVEQEVVIEGIRGFQRDAASGDVLQSTAVPERWNVYDHFLLNLRAVPPSGRPVLPLAGWGSEGSRRP